MNLRDWTSVVLVVAGCGLAGYGLYRLWPKIGSGFLAAAVSDVAVDAIRASLMAAAL